MRWAFNGHFIANMQCDSDSEKIVKIGQYFDEVIWGSLFWPTLYIQALTRKQVIDFCVKRHHCNQVVNYVITNNLILLVLSATELSDCC